VETGDYAAYLAATTAGAPGDRKECKSSQDDIDEASLSFPSGHAGLSFVAMSWAAFALAEAADVAGINDDVSWATPARTAACLPMAYAVYCACTRITDYKHRPEDVIAGALLGAAAAWACRPRRRWNKQHKHAKPVAASGKIHPATNGVK
jgi:phosphatidate phosphatase